MRKRILSLLMLIVFVASFLTFDLLKVKHGYANTLSLPKPGQLVTLSQNSDNIRLKGINVNPDNLLDINFYFDGSSKNVQEDAKKLVEYFLTGLTFDGESLWVNLSPYEQDRVLNEDLASTQLGKVLLKQDYLLKQLSSSLTHPETESGKAYWANSDGEQAFNKIWIAPDKAVVSEDGDLALIKEASLNVLTEADYLAMLQNDVASDEKNNVIKNDILPLIKKDVNQGANFAELRQVYSALILGFWFKKKYFSTLYSHYIDEAKIQGVDTSDPVIKQKVFDLYVESFEKGVYDTIKKETNSNGAMQKKNYFSGGIKPSPKVQTENFERSDHANISVGSAVVRFQPKFNIFKFRNVLLVMAALLLAPFMPNLSDSFSLMAQEPTAQVVRQSEEVDRLIAKASDHVNYTAEERVKVLDTLAVNPDLSVYYLEALERLYYDENSTYEIKEATLVCFYHIKNIKVFYAFEKVLTSMTYEEINNLTVDEIRIFEDAVACLGLWALKMYDNYSWTNKEKLAQLVFPFVDVDIINDQYLRHSAWSTVGAIFDKTDTEYIAQVDSLADKEIEPMAGQIAANKKAIEDRLPRLCLKDFIFENDAEVSDLPANTVYDTVLYAAMNKPIAGDVGYFIDRQVEALDSITTGSYMGIKIADSGPMDQNALNSLEALNDTVDVWLSNRVPSASLEEEDKLKEALLKAINELKKRLGVTIIFNENGHKKLSNGYHSYKGFAHKLNLNQKLDFNSKVTVWNIKGQVLASKEFSAKSVVTLKSLGLDGDNMAQQLLLVVIEPLNRRASRYDKKKSDIYTMIAREVVKRYHSIGDYKLEKLQDKNEQKKFLSHLKNKFVKTEYHQEYDEIHRALRVCINTGTFQSVLLNISDNADNESALAANFKKEHDNYVEAMYKHKVNKKNPNKNPTHNIAHRNQHHGNKRLSSTITRGGIDMNLDVQVSSSALQQKFYSNMTQEQIREHQARSELLAGFTFEIQMQKGKLTINDILSQKK